MRALEMEVSYFTLRPSESLWMQTYVVSVLFTGPHGEGTPPAAMVLLFDPLPHPQPKWLASRMASSQQFTSNLTQDGTLGQSDSPSQDYKLRDSERRKRPLSVEYGAKRMYRESSHELGSHPSHPSHPIIPSSSFPSHHPHPSSSLLGKGRDDEAEVMGKQKLRLRTDPRTKTA